MKKSLSKKQVLWALVLVSSINLLNYLDRYLFSALLPEVKKGLGFSDSQLGLLGSAFIFAYLIASPLFGYLGDRLHRPKLMSLGVALWSIATGMTGLAKTFATQFFSRLFVGFGESAYTVITPALVADLFSKKKRGRVFAIYSAAIPVGSALGYILGGWLQPLIGWQQVFFVVGFPGLLCAFLMYRLPDPRHRIQLAWPEHALEEKAVESLAQTEKHQGIRDIYFELLSNQGFLFTVFGYAAYTFVVGGLAFWMPSYIVRYFSVSLAKGNVIFGGVTVIGGFLGTLLGGWWADVLEHRSGNGFFKVPIVSMIIAIPLFVLTLRQNEFYLFAFFLLGLEVALFLGVSPLDAVVIGSVSWRHRAQAMALNIFLMHALGDGISRVWLGHYSDLYDLRSAISLLPWGLLVAGILWIVAMALGWRGSERSENSCEVEPLQSHRGDVKNSELRENTLEAFLAAVKNGARMIECDLRLSRDHIPVVYHDRDLRRLLGRSERVSELSQKELWEIGQVPTLRMLLQHEGLPVKWNLELKSEAWKNRALAREVCRVVKEEKAQNRVIFSSFHHSILRWLRQDLPNVSRGLIVGRKNPMLSVVLGFLAKPHYLHLPDSWVTEKRVRNFIDRNLILAAWTVNDPERLRELHRLGIHSIISDSNYV